MRDLELGRLVRALRRRRGWRQDDAAMRARVHRSTWSNLERGQLEQMAVATVRRCLAALEVTLDLRPRWRGTQLDRLLDERHATLGAAWVERLERWGWLVRPEVSFSQYGERGRIDLLAWHPRLRILLVVELKTEIVDVQALLGGLDAKARLAQGVARQLGWRSPALVVPAIIASDDSTNRDRVARLRPLFAGFGLRGRHAVSWMRRPRADLDGGLLVFSDLRPANGGRVKSVGSHRVRGQAASRSVDPARTRPINPSRRT